MITRPRTDRLRLLAAADQAEAAAAPLLSRDPRRMTTREQDAARATLGAAKLAIRRAALAATPGAFSKATLTRLRPYIIAIDSLNYWQEQRELEDGAARRAVYDRRRAAAAGPQ